jgi:hypothetical protein
MNEGKKIVLFFMFLATVGSLWVGQTSESSSWNVMAVLSGAAFLYLLLFWENNDPDK